MEELVRYICSNKGCVWATNMIPRRKEEKICPNCDKESLTIHLPAYRTKENKSDRMKECKHLNPIKYEGYKNPMRWCQSCSMIWYGDDIENGY